MNQLIKVDPKKFNENKVNIDLILSVDEFRLVHFYLKKGQKVNLHVSKSHVVVNVLKGKGKFFKGNENTFEILETGDGIYYTPLIKHGFEALEDTIVQAFISPNPVKEKLIKI